MKRIKVLGSVLKRTRADKIIIGFIVFIFAIAAVIQLVEPDINRYGDALWYCYAVISTAGFGDVVAVTFIGKMCSVLLTIYSLFVVAIATGVVVNFYTQMVELQRKETLAMFMDQLERLPELSREELENISRKIGEYFQKSAPVSVAVDLTDLWKNVLLPVCCVPAGSEKLPAFLFRGFVDTEYR